MLICNIIVSALICCKIFVRFLSSDKHVECFTLKWEAQGEVLIQIPGYAVHTGTVLTGAGLSVPGWGGWRSLLGAGLGTRQLNLKA